METQAPTPKRKRGGQPKPPELRLRMMSFKVPPDIADQAREYIPNGMRSQVVADALAAEVARRKAQGQKTAPTAERERAVHAAILGTAATAGAE